MAGILKRAVEILLSLIRNIPERQKKTPEFDAEVFHRMQAVRKRLLQQNAAIGKARNRLERARSNADRLSRPENLFRWKEKKAALKEMAEALPDYQTARAKPDQVVKEAGYKNVAVFTKAYEKSCKLLESMKRTEPQKESIIASLRKYEKEALIHNGSFSRRQDEQTHIKTNGDVR